MQVWELAYSTALTGQATRFPVAYLLSIVCSHASMFDDCEYLERQLHKFDLGDVVLDATWYDKYMNWQV